MKITKEGLIVIGCLVVLAGCSQGEQKAETTTQQSVTIGTQTNNTKAYEGTISGVISDSMCESDHNKMGDLGKDPIACAHKCVEAGAKYVLVDNKGTMYKLSDQRKPKEFAGKAVSVKGHIDPVEKLIHVHSIASQS